MKKDNVVRFEGREMVQSDALTELLNSGTQQLILVAVEAELQAGIVKIVDLFI